MRRKANRRGWIIVIASASGRIWSGDDLPEPAARHAYEQLTRAGGWTPALARRYGRVMRQVAWARRRVAKDLS